MYAFALDVIAARIFPILHVWVTVFTGLIAFGVAGLAATTFLPDRRVSMMAAPLVGIALWPLATLAIWVSSYPTFPLSFDSAARIALAVLLILSLLLLPRDRGLFGVAWRFLAIVAVASLTVAPVVMAASLIRGEPAFLYLDGADHTGYAVAADWYRSHAPQTVMVDGTVGPAIADPTQPYPSGVQLMFEVGTRGGAYAYQALVSMLSGQPAMFMFDAAIAIALIAACLGCAAVFSWSWLSLLCLAGALLTSLWYDYGHMGFLGKLLSYPLAIFTFGVFVSFYRSRVGPAEVLVLAMIAAGAGLMHNGLVYGLLFTCFAASLLLTEAVFSRRPPELAACALAAFAPAIALIATGTLARPFSDLIYPNYGAGWTHIAYLVTDLNSLFPDVALLPRGARIASFFLCVIAWVMLLLFALRNRNATAVALLCGPAALVVAFYLLRLPWSAVQLGGVAYPATLCAGFVLAQQGRRYGHGTFQLSYILVIGVLVALVSLHIPRVTGSVLHYTRDADRRQMFALSDFDRLQAAIGDQEVYIDIRGNARTILPVLGEFGRRNIKTIWSPQSWHIAGSFRGAPVPPVAKMPDLRLIDTTDSKSAQERVLVETPRYKLVGRL
jgi:hypothetical protein